MSLPKKLLLRALAAALILSPVAVGCAANDGPLSFDLDNDAGADAAADGGNVEPEVDAGTPDTGPPANRCGNGKLETGEECDDGNRANGDGCSSTCTRESAGPGDLCSNAIEVPLTQQAGGTLYTASVAGSTADLFNHYGATCGGGSGPEAVYKVTSPAVGRAVARVVSPFATVLSARSGCEDVKTELACKNTTTPEAATEIAFPIFPNAPVYFMVDGFGGSKGDFLLDIEVQTAFCGNGLAEYPETCDDGNTVDGDGCSSTCALEDSSTPSACPGMGYRVTTTASFAGDTSTLAQGGPAASGCTASLGPNAVYAITPTMTGALKLDLLANFPNALLHIHRECVGTTATTQFDCAAGAEALTPLSSTVPVFAEQTIYAFVDSTATSNSGLFNLNVTLTAAACGNGVVDGGEECDDGNTADEDGCSASCTVERAPESYACPGQALRLEAPVPGARTLRVHGTTAPAAGESLPVSKWSSASPTANCQSTARDVVYEITSDIDGYLKATVGGGQANLFASLRSDCVSPQATVPLACSREATGNAPKTFFAPINKETPYSLIVDGHGAGDQGPFVLDLAIEPSVCGNGVVEGGETCDDGATDDGDGCSSTCQLETEKARNLCATAPPVTYVANPDGSYSATIVSGTTNLENASGTAHTLGASCSSNGPDAWFDVAAPISGVLTATITEATFRSSLGVRNGCATGTAPQLACDAAISNGGQQVTVPVNVGQPLRVIVDGQNVTGTVQRGRFTLDLHIVPSGCGDTYVSGAEECDDGNTVDGDGCSSTCTLETLPALAACPGHTVSLTGAGAATRRGVATVQTTGLGSNVASACGGSGPEGMVRVVSDASGILEARATANFGVLLYGRNQCADPATEIPRSSCTSNRNVFTTAVQKDVPVYVYVDGLNGASGVAKLQFTVTP